SLFRVELIRNRGPWKGLDEVEIAVAEYVDWLNHRRLHGEIGLVPPTELEDNFYRQDSVSLDAEALVPSRGRTRYGTRDPADAAVCTHGVAGTLATKCGDSPPEGTGPVVLYGADPRRALP